MLYSNTTVCGDNEYGKSGHLNIFTSLTKHLIMGRFCTRTFFHFYIIFHSVVQTNMKRKFVSWFWYYYKAIYPVVVLRVMPVCYKNKRKKVHNVEDFSASRMPYDIQQFIYLVHGKRISLQLTIALCYLPIVLSNTTRYLTLFLLSFNVW